MADETRDTLRVLSSTVELWEEGRRTAEVRLNDHPKLRELLWQSACAALDEGLAPLFHHVCGRCGECCGRFSVFVGAAEIYAMRRHLGLGSDEEFRDRYLESSSSWNSFDGYLRSREGACPFLTRAEEGRPASCSIYPVRPRACASHVPAMDFCRKDPAKLFSHLWHISISDGKPTFTVGQGHAHAIEKPSLRLRKLLARVRTAFDEAVALGGTRPERLAEQATAILSRCFSLVAAGRGADLSPVMADVEKILSRMADLMAREQRQALELDRLWVSYRTLKSLLSREQEALERGQAPGSEIPRLTLYPQCLTIDEGAAQGASLRYAEHPPLLDLSRKILKEAVLGFTGGAPQALEEPDPPCYLCGECCRVYCVEVGPRDIERLAESLALPEPEFRERYTIPPRFSWNKGCALMRKVEAPGGEKQQCIFLEEREDGLWYCRVHAIKPDVCRAYAPTNRLCRMEARNDYWHRQTGRVLSITVSRGEILIHSAGACPLSLREEEHASLSGLVRRLWEYVGRVAPAAR